MGESYDTTSTPTSTMISTWIDEVSAEIDLSTQTSFTVNTTTDEYHDYNSDQNYIILNNSPLIAITTLAYNSQPLGVSATWVSLTSGEANDYLTYLSQARIRIHSDNYSIPSGYKNIKVTYTWGRSTVPKTIQKLATIMVCERILDQKMKQVRKKSPLDMTIGETTIRHSFASVKAQKEVFFEEVKRIYSSHGKLKVYMDKWNE